MQITPPILVLVHTHIDDTKYMCVSSYTVVMVVVNDGFWMMDVRLVFNFQWDFYDVQRFDKIHAGCFFLELWFAETNCTEGYNCMCPTSSLFNIHVHYITSSICT